MLWIQQREGGDAIYSRHHVAFLFMGGLLSTPETNYGVPDPKICTKYGGPIVGATRLSTFAWLGCDDRYATRPDLLIGSSAVRGRDQLMWQWRMDRFTDGMYVYVLHCGVH